MYILPNRRQYAARIRRRVLDKVNGDRDEPYDSMDTMLQNDPQAFSSLSKRARFGLAVEDPAPHAVVQPETPQRAQVATPPASYLAAAPPRASTTVPGQNFLEQRAARIGTNAPVCAALRFLAPMCRGPPIQAPGSGAHSASRGAAATLVTMIVTCPLRGDRDSGARGSERHSTHSSAAQVPNPSSAPSARRIVSLVARARTSSNVVATA